MKPSDKIFHDETAARLYLEKTRWPDGPFCPFCGQTDTTKALPATGSMGPGWYHCKDCRRKFTVRVGTVYERSKVPLHKWLFATFLLASSKKGMSSHQLHRMLGVTYKTAWFMSHRIREAMRDDKPTALGGGGKTIEVDETYIGTKERRVTPDGTKFRTKHQVMTLVERGGRARSFTVDNMNVKTVRHILFTQASRDSFLMTDESNLYTHAGMSFRRHHTVNHSEKEYVRGVAGTNTVEGYFSIFKRGMKGVYQHCGPRHLHRYLTEFDFRYSNRIAMGVDDEDRTIKALQGIEGKRLTYRRAGDGTHV